jgi:cell division protein FtsQ
MAKIATTATPAADVRLMNVTAAVLATIGALTLIVIALLWAAHRPLFAVRAIKVEGDMAHNSVLTIRANATPKLAGNFFTMDLTAGRRAFESVPWVRQAVVRRVWPNRLSVQLEEHRAAALWINSTNADEVSDKLVNTYGEVFEANVGDVEDEALPTLRGPDGTSAHVLALFTQLQQEFAPMDTHIDMLELSGRGSWRVELDSGAEIELGRGTDSEVIERTRRFVSTLPDVSNRYQQHALLSADLRHVDGYAVRFKGVSTGDTASKSQKN